MTLVGVIGKGDHDRLQAALERIRHITFVSSVTSHVVETSG